MKNIDKHYKDWCGEHHTVNSCHPVHDSADACDFAEYFFKQRIAELLPTNELIEKLMLTDNNWADIDKGFSIGWRHGAKWLRDKLSLA
jgi:hypothetical protein